MLARHDCRTAGRAAAARISFLLHELDKKGVEKALENDGKRCLHLVSPFYELPCDEYERSGMRFVSYLPDFDGEDPEKGGNDLRLRSCRGAMSGYGCGAASAKKDGRIGGLARLLHKKYDMISDSS